MIGQSDDDEEDNMLENQERKVAEIENDDEKEKEKEDDENSDNLETVKIVDEAGIKNACDKNSSAVHGNVGNDVNPVKSKSSEEKSGRDDNDITCDNDDKKQQINNDMDENNTVMEDNNNVPKEPDTEIQAEDNTKVRAENYGESMEDESAEGYYCFDGISLLYHLKRT